MGNMYAVPDLHGNGGQLAKVRSKISLRMTSAPVRFHHIPIQNRCRKRLTAERPKLHYTARNKSEAQCHNKAGTISALRPPDLTASYRDRSRR
ncbi:hypothetical protein C8R44DRAFT_768358 [Mycena epipterygia]|nr:hypothetical protein C8R44DRAFT_768358 [Mycena epipterygia]